MIFTFSICLFYSLNKKIRSLFSIYNIVCGCLPVFVQGIFQVFIQKRSQYIIFHLVYTYLLQLWQQFELNFVNLNPGCLFFYLTISIKNSILSDVVSTS